MTQPLAPAPAHAWSAAGPALGRFAGCSADMALPAARGAWARFRTKTWAHALLTTPGHVFTFAAVDVGLLQTVWVQHADLRSGRRTEHAWTGPPGGFLGAGTLAEGPVAGRGGGVVVSVDLRGGRVTASGEGGLQPSIAVDLEVVPGPPLLFAQLPLGGGRVLGSVKGPVRVRGTLLVDGVALSDADAVLVVDLHRADYPWRTDWRWATFAVPGGPAVQLTHNLIGDDARWNENAVWLPGEGPRGLGPARFTHDPTRPHQPWRVRTEDGTVDLHFQPLGGRSDTTNLGVLRSWFHQLYGRFDGTLHVGGRSHAVAGALGLCEDHQARW
jgi:hypothetical protein